MTLTTRELAILRTPNGLNYGDRLSALILRLRGLGVQGRGPLSDGRGMVAGTTIPDKPIDRFEDNDLGEYAGSFGSPGWEIVTSPALEGSYTVKGVTNDSDGETIASTSGLDRYPEQGYEHRWLVQVDQVTSDGEVWIGYAAQSETGGTNSRPDGYQMRVKPYAPEIEFYSVGGSGSIGTITLSEFLADTTYDLRLKWRTDDTHRIELLDLSGNSLGEATLTNSDYSSGGISMEAQSEGSSITAYIDDITRSSL